MALATAIAALSTLSTASATTAGGTPATPVPPEDDVAEWFDEVDPAMVVDESGDCMSGTPETVFYRGDRIVMQPTTVMSDVDVKKAVNTALSGIYGATKAWATTVERIEFPQPPSGPPIRPVLSVSLAARSDGQPHPVVELARALRHEPGIPSSPDYGLTTATPYSFFWPKGFPTPTDTLTPPRTNVTPPNMPVGTTGGLPIGTDVTMIVYDVGLADRAPGVLPNVTTLTAVDNELIDRDKDGYGDYPVIGHGIAIGGTINTLVSGAAVIEARISDRNGLATDVSAARRIATSLRNMPKKDWPSIIVNAFGTSACDFDTTTPGVQLEPLGLKTVVEVTDRFDPFLNDGFFIVASAGNENSSRETYPAAFDSVLGVGSLDGTIDADGNPWTSTTRTGPKSDFSNYGDWVDAWAPGELLPTNHVTGVAFEAGLAPINGKALVRGTSFAAPVVASMIAEQISITGLDARDAWGLIAASGAAPLPECGSQPGTAPPQGVAVALVSLLPTVTATTPGSGIPVVC